MITVFFFFFSFFASEKITNCWLKQARKYVYSKDKVLLKIYNKLDKKLINEKDNAKLYAFC